MKFLDQVKIHIRSGSGGAGCVSFHRAKYLARGGPDGGDGGRGGDVVLRAVSNLNTLIDFRYKQHFKAAIGGHGMGRNRHGANGESLFIDVPVGTQIFEEDHETLIVDMLEEGSEFCLAKGGNGGFGNAHFKTATNQAPRHANPGQPGVERSVWLRLKLIADAGIIGLPNAGKSTFLATVSRAKPKIADYPFTTLHPNLGVATSHARAIVIADIPGLIEGAGEGAGIGDRFLGHIERTGVLLHLVSCQEEDVEQSYLTVRKELESYDTQLSKKFEIVALAKTDILDDQSLSRLKERLERVCGKEVLLLSSATHFGVSTILSLMADKIYSLKELETPIVKDPRWQKYGLSDATSG